MPTFVLEGAAPHEVVERAFAAFLREDEAELETLYTEEAADICKALGSITNCIGVAYNVRNLRQIQSWYVIPDEDVDDDSILALVSVVSTWAGNTKQWQHYFFLWSEDGVWLITEPKNKIYEYVP